MTRFSVGMSLTVAFATGCLNVPTVETIVPQHGFVDGCTDVVVQGHHLGETATGELRNGTNNVTIDLTPAAYDDTKPDHAQDIGFLYTGNIGANPLGAGDGGFYDVVLTVDGVETMISEGWYFRECIGGISVEGEAFAAKVVGGSEVYLEGCGMDPATVTATIYDAKCSAVKDGTDLALTSVCGSAQTTFALPTGIAAGDYSMVLVDGNGDEYTFGFDAKTTTKGATYCQGLPFTVEGA